MHCFMDPEGSSSIAALWSLKIFLTFACQFVVINFQWQFKLLSMKVFHLVCAFVLFFRMMEARLVVSLVPLSLRGANQIWLTTSVVNAGR